MKVGVSLGFMLVSVILKMSQLIFCLKDPQKSDLCFRVTVNMSQCYWSWIYSNIARHVQLDSQLHWFGCLWNFHPVEYFIPTSGTNPLRKNIA